MNSGVNNGFYGKKHTKETKMKIRLAKLGKPSKSSTKFKKGNIPHTWKGGLEPYWRRKCLERDNYTCQECKLYDPEIMCVDHIKPKSQYPELQFNLDNLRAVCPNCHERKSRKEKGWRNKIR